MEDNTKLKIKCTHCSKEQSLIVESKDVLQYILQNKYCEHCGELLFEMRVCSVKEDGEEELYLLC